MRYDPNQERRDELQELANLQPAAELARKIGEAVKLRDQTEHLAKGSVYSFELQDQARPAYEAAVTQLSVLLDQAAALAEKAGSDADLVDEISSLPIKEVEGKLCADGVDVDRFKQTLMGKLRMARLAAVATRIGEIWPQAKIDVDLPTTSHHEWDKLTVLLDETVTLSGELPMQPNKHMMRLAVATKLWAAAAYLAAKAPDSYALPPNFDNELERVMGEYEEAFLGAYLPPDVSHERGV
jgi:hypothetical protein